MHLKFLDNCRRWGSFIKFSHSIFALPFALVSMLVAATRYGITAQQVLLIVAAVVSARTTAMSFNRIVDREIDARNPRTQLRELPQGVVSLQNAITLAVISATAFFLSAWGLGSLCAMLSPLVLAVLLLYSLTKRFTSYSHIVLGLALALAPGGAWVAVSSKIEFLPVALMLAVLLWVAGFDILYSCQDFEFDTLSGLHSVPVKFGVKRAFQIAAALHLVCILAILSFVNIAGLGIASYIGVLLFSFALLSQYRLVKPDDLSKIDIAFFVRNGIASCLFFICVLCDYFLQSI